MFQGRLGAWHHWQFWPLLETPGVRALRELVSTFWGGGRILLLPWGDVVKPLQDDQDIGKRVLIGHYSGSIVFDRPEGRPLELGVDTPTDPGAPWDGPHHVGLECTIDPTGTLACTWYHPSRLGWSGVRHRLWGPDSALARGFRKARPYHSGGRVHVLPGGIVVTMVQRGANWEARVVGRIDPAQIEIKIGWLAEA
ncbi:MAG TPA: hypothetical protein VNM43_10910 [Dehalococcoidia bacterium]|nr:hypothetical protein [Dehalococcoidia bacterium]